MSETNEEIKALVIEPTIEFFGEESPLADARAYGGPTFEHRPQQTAMAHMVGEAFERGHNLCVEAPTGVGKSFAYLVPAAIFAVESKTPVVVSTETISLQEQLVQKDIPLIHKLLGREFSAAIAKGRSNYLCRRRLAWVARDAGDYLPIQSMIPQVALAAASVDSLKNGSRSEVDVDRRVWEAICCEVGNCGGPKCNFYRSCFYWRARREWERADLIVANHALFFTDLKMKSIDDSEMSLLPAYGALVFDEAHLLEDCASKHLGLRVSDISCRILLNKLFDPEKAKGLMMSGGAAQMEIRELVAKAHEASDIFFNAVRRVLNARQSDELRLTAPAFVEDTFSAPFGKLENALSDYVKIEEDQEISQEASSLLLRFRGMYSEMFDFLNM
ncbi:MAG: DEAD/DEAH box helicase, partial [Victivallales bacterium]|nr:DEAD/DEAH box helicase [Victivallales bacterium]